MMPMFGSPFCQQQIVVSVFLIDVRSFRISPSKTSPQVMDFAQLPSRLHVNLANLDVAFFP